MMPNEPRHTRKTPALWPPEPTDVMTHGLCRVEVLQNVTTTKPVLKLTFDTLKDPIYVTANLAEMIGGAARGALLRWQDHQGPGTQKV